MIDIIYFNLMLRGKPMGHITTWYLQGDLADILCEEHPALYGEYFVLYEGAETEEVYGEAYERGLVMYAKECSKEDAHPLKLDDEDIARTIDCWQPCLTACYHSGDAHDCDHDIWVERYTTWGEAMRDAEEKWAMLPEGFKESVRSRDGRAYFKLSKGECGVTVRDWAEMYILTEVQMPRNSIGIHSMYWNPSHDYKTICYTLVPVESDDKCYSLAGMVTRAADRHGLKQDAIDIYLRECNGIIRNGVYGGDAEGMFDYDGFMPIQNIRYILQFLPSISYSNKWTRGEMTFIDDGELDRALEANKDWLAFMDVRVTRLKDTMRARPDVFEGTYLGSIWDWDTRTEVWPADKEGQ